MNKNLEHKRYQGYLNTPLLWTSECMGIKQYKINKTEPTIDKEFSKKRLRLGLLVEQFVFQCIKHQETVQLLASNLQVIENKKTIGELDCLVLDQNKYLHLEVVYKFYLYDDSIKGNEIDKWIGPNRKDSLKQKLHKLKTQQLPLLRHPRSEQLISQLGYEVGLFTQRVHFKAQLFLPINFDKEKIKILNKECVVGFYISLKQLLQLNQHKFYMPRKLDWLIEPHNNVPWFTSAELLSKITKEQNIKRSVLCWINDESGLLKKAFIVFWED